MWAAVVLTSALVGAGSARLIGGDEPPPTTAVQTTNRPIATEGALESAIRAVQTSVVEVRVNTGFGGSQGSGVVLQPSGLIVTNNHVIDGAQPGRVEVITASGQSIPAEVVAADAAEDLAILRPASSLGTGVTLVEDTAGPPPSGETVFAIGSPFGLQNTVTSGVVSAYRNDDGRPLIQFDAPVNPGNSGGGLFNLQGQLIGIPTSIRSPVNGNVGIAFAVPATRVRAMLARVK